MRKGSLRLRLLAAAALSIAVALFLTGAALVRMFETQVRQRVVSDLEHDLLQLAGSIEVEDDGTLSLSRTLSDPRYAEPYGGRYWCIAPTPLPGVAGAEQPRLRSPSLWDKDLDPAAPLGPEGTPLVLARSEITLTIKGQPRKLMLLAAAHEEEVQRPLAQLRDQMILSLAIIGTILLFGAWVQVAVGLRPLQQIRRQIGSIRAGASQRLSGSFPDEVAPLVTELNDLLDLRDQGLERARRRAGDLAHGVKTPLTVMAATAQSLEQEGRPGLAADIREQTDLMVRHVDRALARARLSSGRGHAASDLRRTAERVVAAIKRLPGTDALTFDIRIAAGAEVPIEQGDLTELLGNLLDNARKWASETVRISYEGAVLAIEDDGPGVPEAELALISQRGRRLDESKQGSGLGLSIVEDIADVYGLRVLYGRSGLGGLRAAVRV
jgi:signal transduction histidine kinase